VAKITARGCHEKARHEIVQHLRGKEVRTIFVLRSDGAVLERSMSRDIGDTTWAERRGSFSIYKEQVFCSEFAAMMKQFDSTANGRKIEGET